MQKFEPESADHMIRIIDAYDAISEFVKLNYGPMMDTVEGLSDIYADTYRGALPGGFPADERTWANWVEACERATKKPITRHSDT